MANKRSPEHRRLSPLPATSRLVNVETRALLKAIEQTLAAAFATIAGVFLIPLSLDYPTNGKQWATFWHGWVHYWNAALEESHWVMPSLLTVAIALYAGLFGESLVGRPANVREETRQRTGIAGASLGGLTLAYAVIACLVALGGGNASRLVGVVLVSAAVIAFGLGVGTFMLGSKPRRLISARRDLRRAYYNAAWQFRIYDGPMRPRTAAWSIVFWNVLPWAATLVLTLVFWSTNPVIAAASLVGGLLVSIASGLIYLAATSTAENWGSVSGGFTAFVLGFSLFVPAALESLGVALVFFRDPTTSLGGWVVTIGIPVVAVLWLLPLFRRRARLLRFFPGVAVSVRARKTAFKRIQSLERSIALTETEVVDEPLMPANVGPI